MAQPENEKSYICIDLKSFYASVECAERGLDPLVTNLVVADVSRTEKTICLAVSPTLKALGIPGRARLFEVVQKGEEVNRKRLAALSGGSFTGESSDAAELAKNPSLKLTYIAARPQMAHYIERSTKIYETYLRFVSAEDIYVCSIDEVFMDVTSYLPLANCTPEEYAARMVRAVMEETGITATAGVGTNLYLAKIAMDIVAKHVEPNADGVRIASLTERTYRELLWTHRPITDFWRVGRGIAKRLAAEHIHTMGDIARCSIGRPEDYYNEDLLYKMLGVNAELLIDHAWGYEPCTISDIRAYQPEDKSFGSGQVLPEPYPFDKGRLIVREMTDALVLDLLEKRLVTDQIVLDVNYDRTSLDDAEVRKRFRGKMKTDWYGRFVPESAHGTVNLKEPTSSAWEITEAVMGLYDKIVNPLLLIRRVTVAAGHVISERAAAERAHAPRQLDLFTDYAAQEAMEKEREEKLDKERRAQEAMLSIRKKFGKNAMLKGMNLEEGARMKERNEQIGGHKA